MYIAIYCSVIAAFCVLAISLFMMKEKHDKKRYDELSKQPDKAFEENIAQEGTLKTEVEKQADVELEDFALEKDEKEEKKESKKSHFSFNPFEFNRDEKKGEDEFDAKLNEYEEFLKQSLDISDQENETNDAADDNIDYEEFLRENLSEEGEGDLDALANFDFDSIKDKSESEIAEMIKNLPPRAQELLMSDILARRKFDDEE